MDINKIVCLFCGKQIAIDKQQAHINRNHKKDQHVAPDPVSAEEGEEAWSWDDLRPFFEAEQEAMSNGDDNG